MNESETIYSHVVWQSEDGFRQVRIVINLFRDIEYLHIREYYLDLFEEWKPGSKGLTLPLEIDSSKELFRALAEILSLAEKKEIIKEYFGEVINEAYQG